MKNRIGLLGTFGDVKAILDAIKNREDMEVKGVVCTDDGDVRFLLPEAIPRYLCPYALLHQEELDLVLSSLEDPAAIVKLRELVPGRVAVIEKVAVDIMMKAWEQRERFVEINQVKEQLNTILDTAQEGIQMVDRWGKILFVNRGYTRITGIEAEDRIGKNVFDVSPGGALAQVLRTGKPCMRRRNKVVGSKAEVISNAAPIMVKGEMVGAVVVFQDITEVLHLTEELRRSTSVIHGLKHEIKQLQEGRGRFEDIVSKSPKMKGLIALARRAAWESSPILISGETGTGKDTIANTLHFESPKDRGPLIKVNCASMSADLLEAELFGCEAGALPGVEQLKVGKLELASGGNIYLDEVGEADHKVQGKLLSVLQEGRLLRVGGTEPVPVEVRVICSTSRDLSKLVEQGKFREDLFFRINVLNLHLPPLRERREDVLALAQVYIEHFNAKFFKKVKGFTNEAKALLTAYRWPGNVRELINIVERSVLMAEGEWITEDLLAPYFYSFQDTPDVVMPLKVMEKRLLLKALEEYGGDVEGKRKAAKALGISLATLYNKIKRYDI